MSGGQQFEHRGGGVQEVQAYHDTRSCSRRNVHGGEPIMVPEADKERSGQNITNSISILTVIGADAATLYVQLNDTISRTRTAGFRTRGSGSVGFEKTLASRTPRQMMLLAP